MNKTVIRLAITLIFVVMEASGAIKCHMWREIRPCECQITAPQTRTTSVTCENMGSVREVIDILRGRWHPNDKINLRLERSNLVDLRHKQFREINVTIESIMLNHDNVGSHLDEHTFVGMSRVTYASFADTPLDSIPRHLWKYLPSLQTVDLGRTTIKEIVYNSFEDLQSIGTIVIPGNQIDRIDRNSIPLHIQKLHLGRNRIYDLNGTLIGLRNLSWLFLNSNKFQDLEGQLPYEAPNLVVIHASHNNLMRVPQLSKYPKLETVFLNFNEISSLDGAISGCKSLERIDLESNQIHTLTANDFLECENLDTLELGHNQISILNNSLLPLKSLETLNMQYNLLTEFSFNEITGLERLRRLDLSFNQISNLIGPTSNLVEPNIRLTELRLDHNNLETLNAALSGLSELLRLDLSYNKLRRIAPDDLINLDQLRLLDISHNQLKTLEDMSKTYLPRLSELKATHNQLTVLERDFHGLPVLCDADLSSNYIVALGKELVTKTRCKIEHGIHDGTYDTLKVLLSDNPILCDASLPEITSEMETNHTKIIGVSYDCPPLHEQPITPRPNGYFGYLPEDTSAKGSALPPLFGKTVLGRPITEQQETPNQIQPNIHPNFREVSHRRTNQFQERSSKGPEVEIVNRQTINDDPATAQKALINGTQTTDNLPPKMNNTVFDPVVQGQFINKLAVEIEELKTRIEEISVQNERLLNKTLAQSNLTTKVP
ncbi:carboxypeptidase N subunit 2 isoform X2 [Anthonomus grandis grandis]|uniref:carboxypeptidase N subunit 2 isoform X2 n=1 Tax=Anthonomus grandis grandis TaxID=2921223 RepID=UPI002165E7B5|nr:carboxypeptidase N subunit 2 isoform X2 [Anthonomus grandis grandis]